MIGELKKLVCNYIENGYVVLGLWNRYGHVTPHIFTTKSEVENLVVDPKYPVATICRVIQHVYDKLYVVVRGCDERAIFELAKKNQINLDKLEFVGIACSLEDAEKCRCNRPYPRKVDVGDKINYVRKQEPDKKYEFWRYMFSKCIKCYGCRNICPVCICTECLLENSMWVKRGDIPPEIPVFHLIRAYHMADKCVGCRECELTCPMGIPLTILYDKLRDDMKSLFNYEAGSEDISPLVTE